MQPGASEAQPPDGTKVPSPERAAEHGRGFRRPFGAGGVVGDFPGVPLRSTPVCNLSAASRLELATGNPPEDPWTMKRPRLFCLSILLSCIAIVVLSLAIGCNVRACLDLGFFSPPPPWKTRDYDFRVPTDFQIGDRFRALGPLILETDPSFLYLSPALPGEEAAFKDLPPGATRVNCNHNPEQLIPAGVELEIIAIKMNYHNNPRVYVSIEGIGTWIYAGLFGHYTFGYPQQFLYDRQHYEKIISPSPDAP